MHSGMEATTVKAKPRGIRKRYNYVHKTATFESWTIKRSTMNKIEKNAAVTNLA